MRPSRLLAAALSLGALVPAARAWDNHQLIRRLALEDVPELTALAPVPVTPMAIELEGINPATEFGYVGASPGETQTPLEILVAYAQEPDWGMDQEMRVSWQQRFMGGYTGLGSQGYFHMYYPKLTLHLPVPVMSMGAAPERSQKWMDLARQAFDAGDHYWGWRFTAWALHYLEDLAQPFHSTQTHRKFIRLGSPIQGTTNCTANYHLLYEHWLGRRIADEAGGQAEFGLAAALKAGGALPPGADVEAAVRKVAKKSHKGFGGLASDCIEYFSEYYRTSEKLDARPEDLDRVDSGETLERILTVSRRYLTIAGQALRGVVGEVLAGSPPQ